MRRKLVTTIVAALVLPAIACSNATTVQGSPPGSSPGSGSLPATGSVGSSVLENAGSGTTAPSATPPGAGPGSGSRPAIGPVGNSAPENAGSGTTAPSARSAGCGTAPSATGVVERTITSEGVERKFQLTIPATYDGSKPLPIVFGLHALTVSYQFVPGMTGFADMAKKHEFVGVAPSGRVAGTVPYWHAAPSADNYDLVFFEQLLDLLEAELCIDTARVFSTGMSNGAQMSSLLACRMSDRFTAVAPVSGVEFFETCDGRPVPVIAFHGDADPIVGYDGSGLNATTIANQQFFKGELPPGMPVHHGVDAAMATWAAHNGCDAEPVEERISGQVRRRTWQHCRAPTILYIVDGGGHAWPGKPVPQFEKVFGPGTTEIDASQLIFDFFFTD